MKNLAKAVALTVVLGGAVIATPAQAWWGGPGSWGGFPGWGGGGPWGGYPGYYGDDIWDWGPMDGNGWGDMTFSTSVGGRGYGRGYNRGYHGYNPYYGGGAPWGYGGYPYGGGAPWGYGGGYPYGGAPGYGPGYGYGRDYRGDVPPPSGRGDAPAPSGDR
jgi:hypothetical protein